MQKMICTNTNCEFCHQNNYKIPSYLKRQSTTFEQRWDLREDFLTILSMENHHINLLENSIKKYPQNLELTKLLQDILQFKTWSWKESDRDEYFYKCLIEFDNRVFNLIIKK
jgi:hypothetical protein